MRRTTYAVQAYFRIRRALGASLSVDVIRWRWKVFSHSSIIQ